jgi:VCBS repeat protein
MEHPGGHAVKSPARHIRGAIVLVLLTALIAPASMPAPARSAACPPGPYFEPPVPYATGDNPRNVVIADFDEDAILDLAVANSSYYVGGPGSVAILRGQGSAGMGDGSFAPAVQYPAGIKPFSLVTGDFDEDGILDLAVACFGYGSCPDGGVAYLRGLGANGVGDGTFDAPKMFAAGNKPFDLVAADFDEDGILDLAVADNEVGAMRILRGLGTGGVGAGRFASPLSYLLPARASAVGTADFDGDGILDLVAACPLSAIYLARGQGAGGTGDGTFASFIEVPAGPDPFEFAIGDFNGDGNLDLMVGNGSFAGTRFVAGTGTGTFAAPATVTSGTNVSAVLDADLDHDGIKDLVLTISDADRLEILHGRGNGTFTPVDQVTLSLYPQNGAVGDFNEDGSLDLAIPRVSHPSGPGALSVLIGACPGGPTPTLMSLEQIDVTVERVRIRWYGTDQTGLAATIERRTHEQGWARLGDTAVDGEGHLEWEDRDITPSKAFAYRAVLHDGSGDVPTDEIWVDVPGAVLALYGARPNPSSDDRLTVTFSLPARQPATLALYDLAGRLVAAREIEPLTAGLHRVTFGERGPLASGLYIVRLSYGGRSLSSRVTIVR